MQVQVQQLVHHVSANADSLTGGIATCRTIGTLLAAATSSSETARTHLLAAIRDADASLQIAELHRSKQNLLSLQAVCVALAQTRQLEARAACALYPPLNNPQNHGSIHASTSLALARLPLAPQSCAAAAGDCS